MANIRLIGVTPSKSTLAGDIRPLILGMFASVSSLSGSLRGSSSDLDGTITPKLTPTAILRGIYRTVAGSSNSIAGVTAIYKANVPVIGLSSSSSSLIADCGVESDSLVGSFGSVFNVSLADLSIGNTCFVFSYFGMYVEKVGLRASVRLDVRIVSADYSCVSAGRQYETSFCKVNPEVYPWFYR